jgi:hypothetical protein
LTVAIITSMGQEAKSNRILERKGTQITAIDLLFVPDSRFLPCRCNTHVNGASLTKCARCITSTGQNLESTTVIWIPFLSGSCLIDVTRINHERRSAVEKRKNQSTTDSLRARHEATRRPTLQSNRTQQHVQKGGRHGVADGDRYVWSEHSYCKPLRCSTSATPRPPKKDVASTGQEPDQEQEVERFLIWLHLATEVKFKRAKSQFWPTYV